MTRARSLIVSIAAVQLTVLVASGCGDDASDGSGGSSSTGETTGGTTTSSSPAATGSGGDADASSGSEASTSGAGGEGAGTASAGSTSGTGGSGGAPSWEGVDPLEGASDVTLVQGGFEFVEGPLWLGDLGVLRWSDIPPARIHQLDGDAVSIWRSESGGSNGLARLADGRMLACEGRARRVAVSPVDAPAFTLVADVYLGDRFNAPNDAIARSDGNLYFTDPDYGLAEPDHEIGFNGVYRVDTEGAVHLVDDARTLPNGIALSPDESTLYVADNGSSELWTYAIAADGTTSEGALLTATAGGPDGMTVDDGGNLYVTTSAGVEVRRADGTLWGTIPVPETPANCGFGGPDRNVLFITARTGLYRVQLVIPGPA
jgi:gluconolactonase